MGIDIANPGAHEASAKSAIGNLSGFVNISAGSITSPVQFFDITLPASYLSFVVHMVGVVNDTADFIDGAFSFDNGATWLNDVVNHDSYDVGNVINNGNAAIVGIKGLMRFSFGSQDATGGEMITLTIDPGSNQRLASVSSISRNSDPRQYDTYCKVNGAATVTPIPSRAATLRILPDGTGAAIPTSGEVITAGSWALLGLYGAGV